MKSNEKELSAMAKCVEDILSVERPLLCFPSNMSIRGFCESVAKQEHEEAYRDRETGRIGLRHFPCHGEVVIIYRDALYHVPFSNGAVKDCNIPYDIDMWNASIRTIFPLGSSESAERTYYLLTNSDNEDD